MKATTALLVMALLVLPLFAGASMPVEKTLTGCVVKGSFYSAYPDYDNPETVYPIRISPPVDLKRYEGKAVRMRGWLNPGDRFSLKKGSTPEMIGGSCSDSMRRLINKRFMKAK